MVKFDILGLSLGKIPILKLLLPYIGGIVIAKFYSSPPIPLWIIWGILFFVFIGITALLFHRRPFTWKKTVITVLCSVFFLVLGYSLTCRTDPMIDTDHFSHSRSDQFIGVIADEPILRDRSVRFPLKIMSAQSSGKNEKVSGMLMVTVARDSLQSDLLRYGDRIAIRNTFTAVTPPLNPREFDYRAYLQNKDIWHQSYLRSDDYVIISTGGGNPLIRYSLAVRERLIQKFSAYMDHPSSFQIAVALIFGYRSQIDAATLQAFSSTGTIHVLSVSGLHVGIVFVLLTFLLKWIDRFPYGRLIRCLLIGVAVWAYVILTGMAPPILRAGIMISFFLISIALGRKQVALNTLCTSALFILLFTPKALFSVGFQLSYMAMLGIFLLYPLLTHFYTPYNKYLRWVVAYSYVSIAAQLFTLPFVLYYFGQFPNYFLLANLFIALPSTLVMYTGLALAICPFDILNPLLGKMLDSLLLFSLGGLQWIENLPYSVVQGMDWSVPLVILCVLFIITLIGALNDANKLMLGCGLLLLATMAIVVTYQNVRKKSFIGWKLYNTRQALALAHIYRGEVVLYSTYDSLMHPNIIYSVMPDLRQYSEPEHIDFIHIPNETRTNSLITLGGRRIALIERPWGSNEFRDLDVIIWRKNNWAPVDSADYLLKPNGVLIFDGSNSDKFLAKLPTDTLENGWRRYILKNNFAYVWK